MTFGFLALVNFKVESFLSSMCLAIENADEPSGELSDTAGFRLMNEKDLDCKSASLLMSNRFPDIVCLD